MDAETAVETEAVVWYTCTICNKDFRFFKSLPKHYIRDHNLSEEEAHYKSRAEKMAKDPLKSKIIKVGFTLIQGGAGHLVFPEKGKRAKIFSGKGRFQSQNRAIKTTVFGRKEYKEIKEDRQ